MVFSFQAEWVNDTRWTPRRKIMETMTETRDATVEAPSVRFEPCSAFHDEAGAVCDGCGWLVEDHRDEGWAAAA